MSYREGRYRSAFDPEAEVVVPRADIDPYELNDLLDGPLIKGAWAWRIRGGRTEFTFDSKIDAGTFRLHAR